MVLVINELGDHQMETYFRSTDDSSGGMICGDGSRIDGPFDEMEKIHQKSFQQLGGEYIRRDKKTCAIRLSPNEFFEVMLVFVSTESGRLEAVNVDCIVYDTSARFLWKFTS